jgi:NAD(P)H-dependent FMN reductase
LPKAVKLGHNCQTSMTPRIAEYIAVAIAVHGAAVAIVNLTPTPKDDEALGNYTRMAVKLYRAVEILAGVVSPLVKR